MPLFEFECEDCGQTFELLTTSANRNRRVECTHCGSTGTRRLMSTFAPQSGGDASYAMPLPMGGCGRCGDPNGPCAM
jgi:putative FmdB family regulatory protein